MKYFYKNRGFWEVLEPIRALYSNRNGYSHIRVAFRELHSEKQPKGEHAKLYLESGP